MKRFLSTVLVRRANHSVVQFFRYTLASAVGVGVDFSILFTLTEWFGLHYLLSAVAGYASGIVVNYCLSVFWVFTRKKFSNKLLEFLLFVTVGLFGMGLNEAVLWFFTEIILVHYLVSKVISILIGFISKYYLRKKILFS